MKNLKFLSPQKLPNISAGNLSLIKQYFEEKEKNLTYPLYSSFDMRIAQHKATIVDANLFPAGFNNLCESMMDKAAVSLKDYLDKHYKDIKNISIYSEAHTRNTFYFLNLKSLGEIITKAGYVCSYIHPDVEGELEGILFSKKNIEQADLIISNNDFSAGYPSIFEKLKIPIIPAKKLIWAIRRKHQHFEYVKQIASEISVLTALDAWLFSSYFDYSENVDFRNSESLLDIKNKTQVIFNKIKEKNAEYKIDIEPVVFIKDNSGTYGMGIMTIRDVEELDNINRKTYNKMSVGKQRPIDSVLIQEGIPSNLIFNKATAEPVIYCINNCVIGSFLRIHTQKNQLANLNSKGMEFYRLCKEDHITNVIPDECLQAYIEDDFVYLTVRIALLATAMENTL